MSPPGEPRKLSERKDHLLPGNKSSARKADFFLSLRFMGQLGATKERVSMKNYLKYATNLSHFVLLSKTPSKVLT